MDAESAGRLVQNGQPVIAGAAGHRDSQGLWHRRAAGGENGDVRQRFGGEEVYHLDGGSARAHHIGLCRVAGDRQTRKVRHKRHRFWRFGDVRAIHQYRSGSHYQGDQTAVRRHGQPDVASVTAGDVQRSGRGHPGRIQHHELARPGGRRGDHVEGVAAAGQGHLPGSDQVHRRRDEWRQQIGLEYVVLDQQVQEAPVSGHPGDVRQRYRGAGGLQLRLPRRLGH